MKYIKDLIPRHSKVLPDYFKEQADPPRKKNGIKAALGWYFGIVFLLSALIFIGSPALFLIFGFAGFLLIPPGHRFLEKKLRFRITATIKTCTLLLLCIASLPFVSHYAEVGRQYAAQQAQLKQAAEAKLARERAEKEYNERKRKDSLSFYQQNADELQRTHHMDEAERQLALATPFVQSTAELEQLNARKVAIASIKAKDLLKQKNYAAALTLIERLVAADVSDTHLQYERALCYSKTGKIKEAVDNLKPLIEAGSDEARKLNDQINPVRRRIVGYVTLCNDGSTSYATGRGACSHHGGVQEWNHPVYEESRKYE